MHGKKELTENLRQYCMENLDKVSYFHYLLCFVQTGNSSYCMKKNRIDENKVNNCMQHLNSTYGLYSKYPKFAIPSEQELNNKYHVQGSPTLVINDQVVNTIKVNGKIIDIDRNRSPEIFKEAICSAFINPPSECKQKLSTAIAGIGIGPLNGTSSASGSCS